MASKKRPVSGKGRIRKGAALSVSRVKKATKPIKRKTFVRIPAKFSRSRKTGKLYASKWKRVSYTGWMQSHGWEAVSAKPNQPVVWKRRKPYVARAKKGRINPLKPGSFRDQFTQLKHGDGTVSHAWTKESGLHWSSPNHDPDYVSARLNALIGDCAIEVAARMPFKYRAGVLMSFSNKNTPEGRPIWQRAIFPYTAYYSESIKEARRKIIGIVGLLFEEKNGSQGSSRIWIRAFFVEIKTEN